MKALAVIFFAVAGTHTSYAQGLEKKLQVGLSYGYQQDNLNWSISGNLNGQNPNVLSKLKWTKVKSSGFSGAAQWTAWHNVVLLGGYERTAVSSGTVSDVDYAADNRSQATYDQSFSDDKGYSSAWYAGAGYAIINNNWFSIIPSVGYAGNSQSLYITDATGQFPGLNSYYNVQWKGGFVRLSSSLKIRRKLNLTAALTYNQAGYAAQGNWNLISNFQHPVSYRHTASGYGVNLRGGFVYRLTAVAAISLSYGYFNWQTGNGTDQLYLSSGQVDKTQLNGVYRNGYSLSAGMVLSF